MLFSLSKTFFALTLIIWSASLCINSYGEPYIPGKTKALTEKWRWRKLEPLDSYLLNEAVESPDGKLYFSAVSKLIAYDGYKCVEYPFPSEFEGATSFDIFASLNGSIYLITTKGLLSFTDEKWKIERRNVENQNQNLNRMVRNAFGFEIISFASTLYQIKGHTLVPIPQITEMAYELSFDFNNRLWICETDSTDERIVSYQFDIHGLTLPVQRQVHDEKLDARAMPRIISSPKSTETWSINWRHGSPARIFNYESNDWTPVDFSDISGNNQHVTGLITSENNLILISKSEIVVKNDDSWVTLSYPDFEVPTYKPFITQRQNGNLIIGGRGESVYEIDAGADRFRSYNNLHFQCDTPNGSLWFISANGELIESNSIQSSWEIHSENVIDAPLVAIATENGTVWVAGGHERTAAVSYYDGEKWTLEKHPELGSMISHLSVLELSDGRIIFGSGDQETQIQVGGAVVYDKQFNAVHIPPPTLNQRPVTFVERDSQSLLIGGLNLHSTSISLDSESKSIDAFNERNWIDHIAIDSEKNVWVAIWNEGVYKLSNGKWQNFDSPDLISSSQVVHILADKKRQGSVWVANSRGISRYDGEHWHPYAMPNAIKMYRESGTLKQSSDGAIWVNKASRNWYFRQQRSENKGKKWSESFGTVMYTLDTDPPRVWMTSNYTDIISPANVPVHWQGIDKWSNTPASELRYSFRYNDEEWSRFGQETSTVLMDMPAGNHTFEVRAMDIDGNMNEKAAIIHFSIALPVFRRPWFLAIVATMILTIGGLVYMLVRQRIRNIVQMDEFKLQFFTNISHELRTPLTVIIGPLESLLTRAPSKWTRRPLELAHQNAMKTLELIDQLLEFRKAETGHVDLNYTHSDIIEKVHDAVELLRPLAYERSQVLEFHCINELVFAWFDSEKLDRIINNLVSNASKYTQSKGKIIVRLKLTEFDESVNVELVVEDNGFGIPKSKIESIFQSFYRANNESTNSVQGSGLGLAYTKKLVDAFSGSISVESPIEKVNGKMQGTRFTVKLQLKKWLLNSESQNPSTSEIEADLLPDGTEITSESKSEKPRILIAEDDPNIREFLGLELRENYLVSNARNGEEALQIARTIIPDIILSDIMMPNVDGKQLCKKIKNDPLTCHIPIILLTALKSEQHEMDSLNAGADDYLSKPVRIRILVKRIQNFLQARDKQHEHFKMLAAKDQASPEIVATNTLDEHFLRKAISITESELSDVQMDVNRLAKKMGMSRMTLYRKFKAITGEPPGTFIRSVRMKKAAEYLKSGHYNVAEAAYSVGFSEPSAFGASFKKYYNCSPSEYAVKTSEKTL